MDILGVPSAFGKESGLPCRKLPDPCTQFNLPKHQSPNHSALTHWSLPSQSLHLRVKQVKTTHISVSNPTQFLKASPFYILNNIKAASIRLILWRTTSTRNSTNVEVAHVNHSTQFVSEYSHAWLDFLLFLSHLALHGLILVVLRFESGLRSLGATALGKLLLFAVALRQKCLPCCGVEQGLAEVIILLDSNWELHLLRKYCWWSLNIA